MKQYYIWDFFIGFIFSVFFITFTVKRDHIFSFEWIGLCILSGIILMMLKRDNDKIKELENKIKELEDANR